jgi:hypothetical protein
MKTFTKRSSWILSATAEENIFLFQLQSLNPKTNNSILENFLKLRQAQRSFRKNSRR